MPTVLTALTPEDALDEAAAQRLDGAIVSTHMALNQSDGGLDFVDAVRCVAAFADFPVAFVARPEEDSVHDRISAAFTSAALYLRKPIDHPTFTKLVRQFLAHASRDRARILIVDNEAFSLLVHNHLRSVGFDVTLLENPSDILKTMDDFRPDLVLLDILLPGVTGFELAHVLRMDPRWRDLAIVFVSACTDPVSRLAAFKSGADDFIDKPINKEDFLARVRSHLERVRLRRSTLSIDSLTGLPERSALQADLTRLVDGGSAPHVAIGILAIDDLKSVNDVYGHDAGDRVLLCLAGILAQWLRPTDLRARWTGTEFAVVLLDVSAAEAEQRLDQFARDFSSFSFEGTEEEHFSVALSYGLASAPVDGTTAVVLLTAAEARLVEAARILRGEHMQGSSY